MTRTILATLVLSGVLTAPVLAGSTADTDNASARSTFLSASCNDCHTLQSAGIKLKSETATEQGGDLSDAAKTWKSKPLAAYLRAQTEHDGAKHTKKFKGSDEELQALVDWLLEQKSE